MGLLETLGLKKKKDDFLDVGEPTGKGAIGPAGRTPELGEETTMPGTPPPSTEPIGGLPGLPMGGFEQPSPAAGFGDKAEIVQKDIEILSSKMDSLKASVDQMNQRLGMLENLIRQQTGQQNKEAGWY